MKKIVINSNYGGFGLSHKAIKRYVELKKIKLYWKHSNADSDTGYSNNITRYSTKPIKDIDSIELKDCFSVYDIHRDDLALIQVVEELGEEVNDRDSSLKIIEIPDDVKWAIEEDGGAEWVAEEHRVWS